MSQKYKVVVYEGIIYLFERVLHCVYDGKTDDIRWKVMSYDDYSDEEALVISHNAIETLMEDATLDISTIHKSYRLPILMAREHQTYDVTQNHLFIVIKGDCPFGSDDVFLTWKDFEAYIKNAF